ncbi:MAG: hypothetical protein FWG51_05620, partial [Firmicutes bacterium]|nr:hypothetical protein [Bacillota bacterium]
VIVLENCYPLLQREDFLSLSEYFFVNSMHSMKFFGGFVLSLQNFIDKNYRAEIEKIFFTANAVKLGYDTFGEIIKYLKLNINEKHLGNCVILIDKENTYIDENVIIGKNTIIYPNCFIKNDTIIGNDCLIFNSAIDNCKIEDNVNINSSTLNDCKVQSFSKIGPFAYLRPGAEIGQNCKIGDFVEIKNAKIDSNTKISHLTYVGDADVGKDCNIGCGVVFCNYDGRKKYHTDVGDNVFIGSNSNLIAPINIESGCFIAAGTTVTDDLKKDSFCIGRSRQTVKPRKQKDKNI